jgi:hypothetical protein
VRDFCGTAFDSPNHGGLTPAALVNVRSCIAQIVFYRQTFALQRKSGGRKPPVGNKTPLQIATVHIRRAAYVQPVAAGVSQPWCGSGACPGKRNHTAKIARRCRCVFRYHGGLTPAALVHVRFCIAKIVILSADGRRNTANSGGRKPPVEKALLC